jgi:hypothetical protein
MGNKNIIVCLLYIILRRKGCEVMADTVIRNESGKFVKGNKCGGRTPMSQEVKQMFIDTSPEAAEKIIQTMRDTEDEKLAVDCGKFIIERAYGKASQTVDVGNKDGEAFKTANIDLSHLTVEELKELLGDEDI